MDEERFWLLVSRKLAGEATPVEIVELQRAVERDAARKAQYEAIRQRWMGSHPAENIDTKAAFARTWAAIRTTQPATRQKGNVFANHVRRYVSIAAVLLIVAGIGYFARQSYYNQPVLAGLLWQEKQTAPGITATITLPDGSVVHLNASSRLQFPRQFSGANREVYLTGEAFFDVVKNPRKPFIIRLKNGTINVLGTSFNVKAFDEEDRVETSVVSGKVAFVPRQTAFLNEPADTVLLTPNMKAIYANTTGTIRREPTDGNADKAWTEGKLIFKATRFGEIARILERTYGVTVQFTNASLKNCRFTASFHRSSLDEVMFLLAKTSDFRYVRSAGKLTISGPGCQ